MTICANNNLGDRNQSSETNHQKAISGGYYGRIKVWSRKLQLQQG